MRKNSFGQGLAIFFAIIGVLFVIGSIGEASEPKCIKAGCNNKQASDTVMDVPSDCLNVTHVRLAGTAKATRHNNSNNDTQKVRDLRVFMV